ncbi:MAG: dihydroorotate dehydrogenase electron transfer subunit [Candidatus Bathyarchaeia archaeon]
MKNVRRPVEAEVVLEENFKVKTFLFRDKLCSKAKPGQFLMVWIVGVDEIPLSISRIGDLCGVTVAKVGEATEAMHRLKVGDRFYIRGPYGNGFKEVGGYVAVVAGGIGLATLLPLIERLGTSSCKIDAFIGFRSRSNAFWVDTLTRTINGKLTISTDDGSLGVEGLISEVFKGYVENFKPQYDTVYTCGPPAMIRQVFQECKKMNYKVQASLEAYMKCGIGMCGSCCLGPYRVCSDGPVFSNNQLAKISELGIYKRGPDGLKIPIQ